MWNFFSGETAKDNKDTSENDIKTVKLASNIFQNWTLPYQDFLDKEITISLRDYKTKIEINNWSYVKIETLKLGEAFIDFYTEDSTATTRRTYKDWVRIPTKYVKFFQVNEILRNENVENRIIIFFVDLQIISAI